MVTSLLVILATFTDEAFDVDHGWTLVTALAIGYMLSRGIAKAGAREPYRVEARRRRGPSLTLCS